jgi:hypothetical protein
MSTATIRPQSEDYASAASDTGELATHHGLHGLAARLEACSWVPLSAREVLSLTDEVTARVSGEDARTLLVMLLGCILAGRTEAAIESAGVWRRGGRDPAATAAALAALQARVEREQASEGRALGMIVEPD